MGRAVDNSCVCMLYSPVAFLRRIGGCRARDGCCWEGAHAACRLSVSVACRLSQCRLSVAWIIIKAYMGAKLLNPTVPVWAMPECVGVSGNSGEGLMGKMMSVHVPVYDTADEECIPPYLCCLLCREPLVRCT